MINNPALAAALAKAGVANLQNEEMRRRREASDAAITTNSAHQVNAPVDPIEAYARQADHYRGKADELANAQLDYSAYKQLAAQRKEQADGAMLAALAAGFAGDDAVKQNRLQESYRAGAPIDVTGGVLSPTGDFIEDPRAGRDAKLKRLEDQAYKYDQLVNKATTAKEKADAKTAQDAALAEHRKATLALQQANLDMRKDAKKQGQRLPLNAITDLSKKEGDARALGDLSSTFKDSYAGPMGSKWLGQAENWFGRSYSTGEAADQANWWSNYDERSNRIRNELFGSALTATEQAAFEAASIHPGMSPQQIRTRIKQQEAAAIRAYEKLVAAMGGSGYDVSGVPRFNIPEAPKPGQVTREGAVVDFNDLK